MDMLKQLNAAIEYIEANLCAEFNIDTAAGIACVTADSFIRFFSYMTGMTLTEYVRRRRLTLAAQDLQHGRTPSVYRKNGGSIKVYPPASFHIMIKGAKEMDFRMIELEDTVVYGVSKQYEGRGYKNREELRHFMWADDCDDVPGKLAEGRWNQTGNTSYDGVWYGIWEDGKYMIARDRTDTRADNLETRKLPAGTYAAFKTESGRLAWEEFPKLFELIFDSWLPASEYRQKEDLVIEVLHLWTDHDLRQKNRYYEVWIPVELK